MSELRIGQIISGRPVRSWRSRRIAASLLVGAFAFAGTLATRTGTTIVTTGVRPVAAVGHGGGAIGGSAHCVCGHTGSAAGHGGGPIK